MPASIWLYMQITQGSARGTQNLVFQDIYGAIFQFRNNARDMQEYHDALANESSHDINTRKKRAAIDNRTANIQKLSPMSIVQVFQRLRL